MKTAVIAAKKHLAGYVVFSQVPSKDYPLNV
jgi:hypothetical protein